MGLWEKLKSSQGEEKLPEAPRCSLAYQRPCCRGQGFTLGCEGAFVHAAVCSCVEQCQACFGRTWHTNAQNCAVPCRTPSPMSVVSAFNAAKLPRRYANATLQDFARQAGNAAKIVHDAQEWLRNFKPIGSKGMIIGGPVGVGKTHFLVGLAKEMLMLGHSVKFVDFFELIADIRAGYNNNVSEKDLLAPLIAVDVLMIDELGKGRNSDHEIMILDQIIMGRYNQNRTIVATTNCDFEQSRQSQRFQRQLDAPDERSKGFASSDFGSLDVRVGPRIFSRLVEIADFYRMTGENKRLSSSR